jgi:integrase
MRAKAIFTVFGRTLPSGKKVFYYQCYDQKAQRQWAKSTGLSRKTEAVAYCTKLFRDGLLIPEQKTPTFAEFSEGWWDIDTCNYLKWRELHEPLSQHTVICHQVNFRHHLKDYFAKYRLNEITDTVLESWMLAMSGKKLKAVTINLAFQTLRTMLGEAVRLKLLAKNPCAEVKKLKAEEMERKILTVDEVRKLFPLDWDSVWDSEVIYKAHKLAACTGLRMAELRGLRGDCVFDDYIFVKGQYGRFGYLPHTKTKQNRNIPLMPLMKQELEDLLRVNGDGYVFSDNDGEAPISTNVIDRHFSRALKNIGIGREEKAERNLSFHACVNLYNE